MVLERGRFGAYRLVRRLGSGSSAEVWLAEALTAREGVAAGDRLALKILHPASRGRTACQLDLFRREIRALRRVRHPNVVRFHEEGTVVHGGEERYFFAMEYVEGRSLAEIVRDEGARPELALDVALHVAGGLRAIHELGIVHRDIKPANLILTHDQSLVKIGDFGCARGGDNTDSTTFSGLQPGTLRYAAPEQLDPDLGPVGPATDLYSLGVTLHELVLGRPTFDAADMMALRRRILDERPPPLDASGDVLPVWFHALVEDLLEKRPERRIDRAETVLEVLRAGTESTWWTQRSRRFAAATGRAIRRPNLRREAASCGRHRELSRLLEQWAEARDSRGSVVVLSGPPGAGKTRLIDELAGAIEAREREEAAFLYGAFLPGGAATAAGAFSTAFREYLGEQDLEPRVEMLLGGPSSITARIAGTLRGETPSTGATPFDFDAFQASLLGLLRAIAARQPTVLAIEDLENATPEALTLFACLAQGTLRDRVLLVGSVGPLPPPGLVAALQRLERGRRVHLPPLSPRGVRELICSRFGAKEITTGFAERIRTGCGGNPLYVLELLRDLEEAGKTYVDEEGVLRCLVAPADIRPPPLVRDLVRGRLEALDDEERDLLDVAATVGFEFDAHLLAEVLGRPPIRVLQTLRHIDQDHRLIQRKGLGYTFENHQVLQVVYEELAVPLREEYHALVAETLLRRVAADPGRSASRGEELVRVCEHFLDADRGAAVLPHLEVALAHLEANFHNEDALLLIRRVLDVSGLVEARERFLLLLRRASLGELVGRCDEASRDLLEALDLAQREGDPDLLSEALARMALHHRARGSPEDGGPLAEKAVAFARESGSARALAFALGALGETLRARRLFARARACHEEQVSLATTAGDFAGAVRARLGLVRCMTEEGRPAIAHAGCLELLGDLERAHEPHLLQAAFEQAGALCEALGRPDEAIGYLRRASGLAREVGSRVGQANALAGLARLCLSLGRLREALEHARRARALQAEVGSRSREAQVLGTLAEVERLLGMREEARRHFQAQRELCRGLGRDHEGAEATYGLACVEADEGRVEEALALCRKAEEAFSSLGCARGARRSVLRAAATTLDAGDRAEAAALLQTLPDAAEDPTLGALDAALRRAAGLDERSTSSGEETPTDFATRMEARWFAWVGTRERTALESAYAALMEAGRGLLPPERKRFLEGVPLHARVFAAWEDRGE